MKKILLITTILVVAFGASAKFRWGPTAGVNFSKFYWSQKLFNTEVKPGYSAGLQCELMIPGIGFGVDFGLKYANRGGTCNFGEQYVWSSDGIENKNLRLHTLQIPLNVRFKYTKLNGIENFVAPYVFAGPQFNINVAKSDCDAVKKIGMSVGLECGLGVELFKRYQLSGGYVWDMTDDVKSKKLDNFNAHIQGWMIDFAVLF